MLSTDFKRLKYHFYKQAVWPIFTGLLIITKKLKTYYKNRIRLETNKFGRFPQNLMFLWN